MAVTVDLESQIDRLTQEAAGNEQKLLENTVALLQQYPDLLEQVQAAFETDLNNWIPGPRVDDHGHLSYAQRVGDNGTWQVIGEQNQWFNVDYEYVLAMYALAYSNPDR